MPVEIPHQIINPPSIQRNVQVSGGTNWDLSRTAVQTPIRQLPDPEPIRVAPAHDENWASFSEVLPSYSAADNIPAGVPSIFTFAGKNVSVSKAATKALKALPKSHAYVVVGHADSQERSPSTLSWSRAKNVAAALKRSGHKVTVVKGFGAERPASTVEHAPNRRVEVYSVAK